MAENSVRYLQYLLNCSFILAVGIVVYCALRVQQPIDSLEIVPVLDIEPLQVGIDREEFSFDYRGSSYNIQPVARYEIQGLVVSQNDINAFADIYHDENSVDVKDLCLLWGDNLADNLYHELEIWSEPWTCNFKADSMEVFRRFDMEQGSNNHLLASNEDIRQTLSSINNGDQVALKGLLVNYAPREYPEMMRKTSTVRSDKGDGACEVLYVEEVTILQRAHSFWHWLSGVAWTVLTITAVAKTILFFTLPFGYARAR